MESLRKDDLLGMTGSKIIPKKQKIPKGVFVIAAISTVGFIASFFDNSQLGLFYTVLLLADLLLVARLFLRLEMARKLLFWVAIATVVLNLLFGGLFYMMVNRAEQLEQEFIAEAQRLNEINPQKSKQDQDMLDNMQKEVEAAQNNLGDLANLVYLKVGITAVAYAGSAVYLTRPKVKEAFHKNLAKSP
jgi:hypothetical protein